MAEVYVVQSGSPDDDFGVRGVFSTREKADGYVRKWRDREIAEGLPDGWRHSEEAVVEAFPIDPEY